MGSLTWKGGAGDWSIGANWSVVAGTDGVPGVGDDATISASGHYVVTVSDVRSVDSLLLSAPNGQITIGSEFSFGSLTVTGANAQVNVSGTLAPAGGTGTVLLSQGTLSDIGGVLLPGTYVVAGGSAVVSGGTLQGTNWQGPLSISGLGTTTYIGGGLTLGGTGGGPGTATIDSTTVVFVDNTTLDNANLAIAETPSSVASVVLGGSTLTLGTSMLVTASGFPGAIQFGGGGTVVNLGTLLANSAINLPGTFINAGTVAIFSNNQSAASNFVNNGLVEITDGSFLVSALAGTGTVELMSNAGQTALLAAPTIGAGQTLLRLSGSFIIEANSIDPQAIISGFNAGSSVRINGLVDTGNVNADFTGTVASGTLTVTNSGSVVASWHLVNVAPGLTFVPAAVGGNTFIEAVACFAAGTGIATPSGVRPVETLRAGDAVCLAAGGQANLRWVGHRKIDPRRHARPQDVCPVRVRVGAFGPGVPQRDLRLSPDHAIACDDILIPVRYLINGLTICQEPAKMVQYFHLELPDHALILAEGLACESYLDTGNRGAFANGGDSPMLHADFARGVWARRGCAPLVIDGPRLESARRAVAAVAAAQGERITEDAALRLVVDGRVVPGERNGPVWSYRLPAGRTGCGYCPGGGARYG